MGRLHAGHIPLTETNESASEDAEAPPKRGRGRPKVTSDSELGRLIVDKAFDRMLSHGYEAMRMDDLALDCRVSKRTIYRLFHSKLQLFAAMVETHRGWMMNIPAEADDGPLEETLAGILGVDIPPELDEKRRRFIDVAVTAARQHPEVGELLRRHGGEKAREALTAFFAELHARGQLGDSEPGLAARTLMDLAYGAIPLKSGGGSEWPGQSDRRAYLQYCIRFFIKGIER